MSTQNIPVIVGVSQILQRLSDPLLGKEPVQLMVDAVRAAAEDAGNAKLIDQIESVRVIRGVWRYKNPAQYVADALNLGNVETCGTPYGGNMVQNAVNQSVLEIQDGSKSCIVITGAENGNSQAKALKAGVDLPISDVPGTYSRMLDEEHKMSSDAENNRGIRAPIQIYPIFENAIRFNRGESIEAHQKRISELWAGFSKVASNNPHAWIQDPVTAETIRTASASNRMISFPYPKLMNSNNAVDMASALLVCSTDKARQMGIPESQWIYPWSGTDAHDTYFVSNRDNLHSSPAIRIAGMRALELLGMTTQDIDLIDVYSCFPSAVQVAVQELGLDDSKPLTITGGLTFGGGPLNNYVMHSISRMVELLREAPGKKGMITANGGYLTKHAFGIYSSEQPPEGFKHENVQPEVDATFFRESVDEHDGVVTVESYTVMYGPQGPVTGHTACLLPDGRRTWANVTDADTLLEMTKAEFCGKTGVVNKAGDIAL